MGNSSVFSFIPATDLQGSDSIFENVISLPKIDYNYALPVPCKQSNINDISGTFFLKTERLNLCTI